MKAPRRPARRSARSSSRATNSRSRSRRRYSKPRVEVAGSVFERTKALGSGTKDGLSGSVLL